MRPILKHFGVFLVWYLGSSLVVALAFLSPRPILPPPLAPVLILLLFLGLMRGYLVGPGLHGAPGRRASIRIRPLRGATLRWTLVATPVLLLLSWALQQVYLRLVPVPPESFDPFAAVTGSAIGRLTLSLMAVGIAPVLEEFVFRGLIQHALERRWGAPTGIAAAAALFAAMHVLPWIFPLHLFLGAAFGFAVYATRSIWAGVLLHAANNTVALLAMLAGGAPATPIPTLWQGGLDAAWWSALLLLLLAAAAAVWTARRLWEAGREVPLRAPEPSVTL